MVKPTRIAFVNAADRIRGLPRLRRERIAALASEMAAEIPDGTTAEIPMKNGKPVKSKVRAE